MPDGTSRDITLLSLRFLLTEKFRPVIRYEHINNSLYIGLILGLLYRPLSAICKALSDENRLRILMAISREKKSVSQIVEELGLSQPLVSHHLKELRRNLLLKVERSGPFVYYEIADGEVLQIIKKLNVLVSDLIKNQELF
ncbi:MAG: ArsR/SmtB-type metalloregulator TsoR [Thermodesulfobacteriota bacterium]